MLAVILAIALAVSLSGRGETDDSDSIYRDQNGDHVYYDQSIIEKKKAGKIKGQEPKPSAKSQE